MSEDTSLAKPSEGQVIRAECTCTKQIVWSQFEHAWVHLTNYKKNCREGRPR